MINKLFVTDLDGTLLNSKVQVSNFTVNTINTLIKKGVKITYSTARSYYTASKILKKINFNLPCITFNGAYIINSKNSIVIRKNLLDLTVCESILKKGKEMNLNPYIFGKTKDNVERLIFQPPTNDAQKNYLRERKNRNDQRLHQSLSFNELKEIINLSYLYTLNELEPFVKYIKKQFKEVLSIKVIEDIYNKGFFTLEVSNCEANKGNMLAYICDLMQISLENVVVIGDQINDLEMFQIAGYKVAVGNAHLKIKNEANLVIKDNDEDGVGKYLSSITKI